MSLVQKEKSINEANWLCNNLFLPSCKKCYAINAKTYIPKEMNYFEQKIKTSATFLSFFSTTILKLKQLL